MILNLQEIQYIKFVSYIQGVPRDILFLKRADREKKNQEENVL